MTTDKTHLLYAFIAGLAISDIVPTPADIIFFNREQVNKQKLEEGKITPKQYWTKDVGNYYLLNSGYWLLIGGLSIAIGKSFEQKRNIFIGLLATGAVFAVIHKNIKKDEEFYKTHKLVETQK